MWRTKLFFWAKQKPPEPCFQMEQSLLSVKLPFWTFTSCFQPYNNKVIWQLSLRLKAPRSSKQVSKGGTINHVVIQFYGKLLTLVCFSIAVKQLLKLKHASVPLGAFNEPQNGQNKKREQ